MAIITGATRGIGRATAIALATRGYRLILVGRDEARLDVARDEAVRAAGHADIDCVRADFASLDSVRRADQEIAQRWPAIQLLVNNVGINSARRATSAEGHELTFAVNHLAPFLFSTLLVPALAAGSPARIINITSVFMHFGRLDPNDLMLERAGYGSTRAYTQSKLATAMFTIELAERVAELGITVNCVSPGLVATDLLREHWWSRASWTRPFWRRVLLTPESAAQRIVRVATADELNGVTGQCFGGSLRPISMPRIARRPEPRRRLWTESVRLTGSPDVAAVEPGVRHGG